MLQILINLVQLIDYTYITKLDNGYPPIPEQWLGGSIATDMAVVSNRAQRTEFLQEFINNKNQIFSDQNMKLIKQIYGNDYTDALSNILERMETGQNRKKGKDKEFNSAMNWINQSVGAVMSINLRSAILQQLSIVNYMNWNFNNPIKMGVAMANVPQSVDVSVNKQKQSYINLVGKKAYDLLKYISTSLKAKNIGQVLNALDIDYIGKINYNK